MKITKFTKLKDNRYRVSFLAQEDVILYDDIILKYNLLNQKNITEEKLEEIIKANDELASYYKALKYLAIKMRTSKEIKDYLKKNGFSDKVIISTIKRLEKEGYINEEKYIHAYILDQINLTLNGPDKIKKALLSLALKEENIDNELAKITEEVWSEKINKIILKRKKVSKDSKQIFFKKINEYLYRQGYPKDLYISLLKDILVDDQDNFKKVANTLYQKLSRKYENEELIYYFKNKLYAKGYTKEQIDEYIDNI